MRPGTRYFKDTASSGVFFCLALRDDDSDHRLLKHHKAVIENCAITGYLKSVRLNDNSLTAVEVTRC